VPAAPSGPGPRAPIATSTGAPAADHLALALYYHRIGDFENALSRYLALLEQNEASAEVHNNLGVLHQDRGNDAEAIRALQRAITIDPRYVKAHNNLGVVHLRGRRLEQAAAEFRIALGLDARNVESLVNLALVQRAEGRPAAAADLLREALEVDPRHPGSHYNLAVVADEIGDSATAISHYRAFLRYGIVAHPDLAARVRTRLTSLGS
jgi:Tfp pilus assembly protein PilF